MADWFARPLTARPEGEFNAYAWADHTGWHFAPELPEHIVPTGHVWAWGENDWATWREEPGRCVGIRVRHAGAAPGEDWQKAKDEELKAKATCEPPLPSLHRDKRFFRSDSGEVDWHGLPARILKVTSPVRVDLFNCPMR